jgi:creatinine amidohydrolase
MSQQELAGGGYSVFHGTMADMTYPEVAAAAREGAVVLWGFGVIEQHGPHLPLATDVYMPYALLRKVAGNLTQQGVRNVTMPPFYWGINHVTGLFPGTFEVRPAVMVELMVDLIKSLKKDGFRQLFCVSGHGDAVHNRTMHEGIARGAAEAGIQAYFVGAPSFFKRIGLDPGGDPHVLATAEEAARKSRFLDVHAGEYETSSMRAFFPGVVRTETLSSLKATDLGPEDLAEWRKGREHAVRKTPLGYFGDPASSDPETGVTQVHREAGLVADAIAAKAKHGPAER